MRKIKNPYIGTEAYNCFGCSPNNAHGLQMEFYEEGDFVISRWQPKDDFQGYNNVLHGGIQVCLMDEIASWTVYVKLKTAGVTSKIETKFLKTVYIDKGKIILKAHLRETKNRFAIIDIDLLDQRNSLLTKSTITYYTFPEDLAKGKLNFPGYESFFE